MNAGLPGTGIGGVFYLLSALLMPFFELAKTLRGQSAWSRWALIFKQLAMATGIVAGMWGLGVLLGLLIEAPSDFDIARLIHMKVAEQLAHATKINVFHIAPVLMSVITLTIIITITNVLRIFYRPPNRR